MTASHKFTNKLIMKQHSMLIMHNKLDRFCGCVVSTYYGCQERHDTRNMCTVTVITLIILWYNYGYEQNNFFIFIHRKGNAG